MGVSSSREKPDADHREGGLTVRGGGRWRQPLVPIHAHCSKNGLIKWAGIYKLFGRSGKNEPQTMREVRGGRPTGSRFVRKRNRPASEDPRKKKICAGTWKVKHREKSDGGRAEGVVVKEVSGGGISSLLYHVTVLLTNIRSLDKNSGWRGSRPLVEPPARRAQSLNRNTGIGKAHTTRPGSIKSEKAIRILSLPAQQWGEVNGSKRTKKDRASALW